GRRRNSRTVLTTLRPSRHARRGARNRKTSCTRNPCHCTLTASPRPRPNGEPRRRGLSAMKLGLINSAWAQAGKDTAYGIRMTREIGFDTIDVFADPLDLDAKERRLIKRECDRVGLPIVSIACVAVGLIDFNPSVQRFHLERCRKYLDLACEYEAKNLLLVLGEYIWERQVIPPQEQWQTACNNVRELGKYAAGLGLQIALELEPFKLSLLNNV